MWKKIVLCIVLIIGIAGPGFAQNQGDVSVEFEAIDWFADLSTNILINGDTHHGTEFNLEQDFGIASRDLPSARFTWFTGPKSRIILDYMRRDFSGQKVLDRQITFGDSTFDVGASASIDWRTKMARLGWIWQFITARDGFFKLGTILEARAVSTEIEISGQAGGVGQTREDKKIEVGYPTLGFALDVNPGTWINIYARMSGMSFGRYGYLADGETGIKLFPIRNLSVSGGYRYQATEGRSPDTDSHIRFTFKGPFAAASLRF